MRQAVRHATALPCHFRHGSGLGYRWRWGRCPTQWRSRICRIGRALIGILDDKGVARGFSTSRLLARVRVEGLPDQGLDLV